MVRRTMEIHAMKAAKVIAMWGGRRAWQAFDAPDRRPYDGFANYEMQKIIIAQEKQIDIGSDMDLIIVNSKVENPRPGYEKLLEYLNEIDGTHTKNGKITVLQKNNVGISHGAFDYAFQMYTNNYDYWYFSEDDRLNVADGIMPIAVDLIESNAGNIGFVGTTGMKTQRSAGGPKHWARSGSGITSTKYLKEILKLKINDDEKGAPHLPFCRKDRYHNNRKDDKCFEIAERNFTFVFRAIGKGITNMHYHGIKLCNDPSHSGGAGCCLGYKEFLAAMNMKTRFRESFGKDFTEEEQKKYADFIKWFQFPRV